MARVWRDGPVQRPVTIYRLLAAGTIERRCFSGATTRREAKAAGVAGEGELIGVAGDVLGDELAELVKYSAEGAAPRRSRRSGLGRARETRRLFAESRGGRPRAAVAAVAQLAGDGGRARAVKAAEEAAAARPKPAKRTGLR